MQRSNNQHKKGSIKKDKKNIKPIFTKEIDLSNKNDMVEFLAKHPRYWTMNGWNELSSYAQNVKLHNLRLQNICGLRPVFLRFSGNKKALHIFLQLLLKFRL